MVLKNKSFTLIEAMIVLLVFIIGIGIFAVTYINLVKQYLVNQKLQATLGNLRLALEKIWRDIKYGVNFNITNNSIEFKRGYDCKRVVIYLEDNSLIYNFENTTSTLIDPNLIQIDRFQIYSTGTNSSGTEYRDRAPKLIALTIEGRANMQTFYIPLNFQISIAPINSVFPSSTCP